MTLVQLLESAAAHKIVSPPDVVVMDGPVKVDATAKLLATPHLSKKAAFELVSPPVISQAKIPPMVAPAVTFADVHEEAKLAIYQQSIAVV